MPYLAGVGEHGERLELRDGGGDGSVLLLGGLGIVPPQIAVVRPPHPAPRMLLEFPCYVTSQFQYGTHKLFPHILAQESLYISKVEQFGIMPTLHLTYH